MRFAFVAVLALVLTLAGRADAQSWVRVATDPAGNSFDIDMSLVKANGGFTEVWVRQTLVRPQRDAISGKMFTNTVIKRMEDCRARTFALTLYVYRNDKGEVMSSTPVPQTEWNFVSAPPGSIAASLQAKICEVAAARASLKASLEVGPNTETTWLPAAFDPKTQTKYFIARDSVVSLNDGLVGLIAKADLGVARKLPDGSMAITGFLRQAFNCNGGTTMVISADSYDSAGQLVGVYAPPHDLLKADAYAPGSSSDLMAKYACDPAHVVETEDEHGTFVGTGWLGPKGYMITANHVIEGATKLELAYDGKIVGKAEIVVTDPANDIAILKPILLGSHPIIPFYSAPARLGDRVFTLGYPAPDVLGMALKMTSGEVSAMSGNDAASGRMDDVRFMQVSIPVHSGNSGGPVVDSQGRAVGMVISKMNMAGDHEVAQNVNYALKIGYVRSLMAELPALGTPPVATPRPSLSALVAELQGSVFLVIATR